MVIGGLLKALGRKPALAKANFLKTGNLQPLPALDDFDKIGSRGQAFVTPRIKPGSPPAKHFDRKLPGFQVYPVQVGDL